MYWYTWKQVSTSGLHFHSVVHVHILCLVDLLMTHDKCFRLVLLTNRLSLHVVKANFQKIFANE